MKYGTTSLGQIEAAINRLGGEEGLRRFLAGELIVAPETMEKKTNAKIVQSIPLRLDRTMSPKETLIAAKKVSKDGWIYPWMLQQCPVSWVEGADVSDVTVHLIDMGRDWKRDEALIAIRELGLERAEDNCALWTLSAKHPDLQRELWVVDPGHVWLGEGRRPCVAYVCGVAGSRGASLNGVANRWNRGDRVLAVSK